ncbi:MAG: hypothetical protein GX050_00650 [Firmicutes bacterium]|nr:hypothetical protein [Bacillota bacterium]
MEETKQACQLRPGSESAITCKKNQVIILKLSPHNRRGGEKVHNQTNNQNQQNQGQQAQPNLQNVQNYNNMANMESGTELTQSTGEISRILATQRLVGLEIGKLGENAAQNQNQYQNHSQYQNQNQNQYQNQYQNQNLQMANDNQASAQLEVEQAPGQISQSLSQQSQQKP